jgi:hypothetical protein
LLDGVTVTGLDTHMGGVGCTIHLGNPDGTSRSWSGVLDPSTSTNRDNTADDESRVPVIEALVQMPIPSPSSTTALCTGDSNRDKQVTVDEPVEAVSTALGEARVESCPSADTDGRGDVTIDKLIRAVNNAPGGCDGPATTATSTRIACQQPNALLQWHPPACPSAIRRSIRRAVLPPTLSSSCR